VGMRQACPVIRIAAGLDMPVTLGSGTAGRP
jgi:hypothetical protein